MAIAFMGPMGDDDPTLSMRFAMKCPVCRVPTYVVEYKGIELDLCPDCAGVWFDRGELDLLLPAAGGADLTAAQTREEGRPCPLCSRTMSKMNIGPGRRVLVDDCATCGLWFDRHEVEDLSRDLVVHSLDVDPALADFLGGMFPVKGEDEC